MTLKTYTNAERFSDALDNAIYRLIADVWAPIALEDNVAHRYWNRLKKDFPKYQFTMFDENDQPIVAGNCVPIAWNGNAEDLSREGWDWAVESCFKALEDGTPPNTLCALGITVARGQLGKGISREAILAMKSIAAANGLQRMVAPVRPTLKVQYPLTPMERYITWMREDGAPFDPWLRTHWRLGGKIIKICERSMLTQHPIAQFERITSMKFPESGDYIVPGALNPVQIDCERDLGTYLEPNVWVQHAIQG